MNPSQVKETSDWTGRLPETDASPLGRTGWRTVPCVLQDTLSSIPALLLICLGLLPTVWSQATSRASGGEASGGPGGSGGVSMGGLRSVLEDAISPAFGATIIIIITVVVSGSAYLCFLKYVCTGCCKPTQVAPTLTSDPNKVEEQV